jgi:hypothetical protein
MPLGYPVGGSACSPPRKPLNEIVYWEGWKKEQQGSLLTESSVPDAATTD